MSLIIIGLFFAAVIGGITYQQIQKMRVSARNNALPILTSSATLISKRKDIIAQPPGINPKNQIAPSTTFFASFRLPDSQTVEVQVDNVQFAALTEGEQGRLTYQGTRFLGFVK
jgi:hypothetical protein